MPTGRMRGPWPALWLALAAIVAGCDEEPPQRDTFAEVRARLDAARDAPPASQVTGSAGTIGRGPSERAIRGFVRRAPQRGLPVPTGDPIPSVADVPEGDITLDFQGADLASVVQVMMEDGLGANYVLDPRVRGTVTLKTNRPLRQSEILPTLEEILRLNNAALVERGGTFRVLPRAEAGLAAPIVSARDARARGLTVRVTPLRFVSVDDISAVLESFAPVAGSIRYDRARNLVFITGTPAEQQTLMDVIATLDRSQLAGRSFALVPLQDALPGQMIAELNALFGGPAGQPSASIRFLPIQRMGAILVIAQQQVLLDEALEIIRHLDQGRAETPTLHVYSVANRRASELALILGAVFDAEVEGGAVQQTDSLAPGLEGEIGAVDGVDGGVGGEPAAPDTGFGGGGDLGGFSGGSGGSGSGRSGVLRIVADEASNAIVALATADGAEEVAAALKRLDVQPLQVMIEATLLEVALNDQLEYGVRWFLESGNFAFGINDAVNPALGTFERGFNAAFATDDILVTVSALDAVTDVRMLSSPTLMVLDNQAARLQVGDQVPITVRTATPIDADAAIAEETEYRDTGVILEIRPTVNAGGLVSLRVRQEISDVVSTVGDADNPTFSQRVVESTIAVQSGETIALAGLIEEDREFSREGLPILSELPVIGGAFGTTSETVDRTELIVLIRPVVVRDQNSARAATEELRQRLTGLLPPDSTQVPGLR